MIENEIILNKATREIVNKELFKFGIDGENLQENIIFKFEDEFVDGQARVEIELQDETKTYIIVDKHNETYELPIKSVITKQGLNYMQLVIDEGTDENAIPIFKSEKFSFLIKESINAVEEAPEGYTQWIEIANEKLNEIDVAIEETNNLDLDVVKEGNMAVVTLTKKDGTKKEVDIYDGSGSTPVIENETMIYRQGSGVRVINEELIF